MAEDWTLTRIISSTRRMSGRLSPNDMSEADIKQNINTFYCNELPLILAVKEFNEWHAFNLTASKSEYLFSEINDSGGGLDGEDLVFIGRPLLLDGDEIPFTLDAKAFYEKWPQSATYTDSRPTEALLDGGRFVFMDPPDDAYEVKFPIRRYRPTALSEADDYPLNKRWGKLIAAGSAKLIKEENEEDLESVLAIINEQKILFAREVMQQLYKERGVGRY